jgi:hypothetical protein
MVAYQAPSAIVQPAPAPSAIVPTALQSTIPQKSVLMAGGGGGSLPPGGTYGGGVISSGSAASFAAQKFQTRQTSYSPTGPVTFESSETKAVGSVATGSGNGFLNSYAGLSYDNQLNSGAGVVLTTNLNGGNTNPPPIGFPVGGVINDNPAGLLLGTGGL